MTTSVAVMLAALLASSAPSAPPFASSRTAHWQDFTWGMTDAEALRLAEREQFRLNSDPMHQPLNTNPNELWLVFDAPAGYADYFTRFTRITLGFVGHRLAFLDIELGLRETYGCENCLKYADPAFATLRSRLIQRYGAATTCFERLCEWDSNGVSLLASLGSALTVSYSVFTRTEWRVRFAVEREQETAKRAKRSGL